MSIKDFFGPKTYSPYFFAWWRIVFGIYLAYYFLRMLPYAAEIYSSAGVLPRSALNWTYGYVPNILSVFDSTLFVECFIALLFTLSLFIAAGLYRRMSALLLWYGWACLMNRNILTIDPSLPFIGWLLLALAIIPIGEPLARHGYRALKKWYMPSTVYWGAWIILGSAYTVSGIDRMLAPSWQDGTAFMHMLNLSIAYDTLLRTLLLSTPLSFLKLLSWAAACMFTLSLPLMLWKRTQPFIWTILTAMFVFVFLVFDLVEVVWGILLFYFFLFNTEWWQRPHDKNSEPSLVIFDDRCGVCRRFVRFIVREDYQHRYQYVGFSGETVKTILNTDEIAQMSAMVLLRDGKKIYGGDAVLETVIGLGGIWNIARLLYVVPSNIRTSIYGFLGGNRHKICMPGTICDSSVSLVDFPILLP